MQKSKMEVESVMGENGEGSNNVIIRQHEEDENESRPVGNIEGDASGDKQDSPRGKSSKRRKYSKHRANKVQELEACILFALLFVLVNLFI